MRSGAVARILGMPATTLRVWERRYHLTQARVSEGGQRLYGADEVRRLALIKQLKEMGHGVGNLAPLSEDQLRGLAQTHAVAAGLAHGTSQPPDLGPLRLAVVGAGLGPRLQRVNLLRHIRGGLSLLGPFDRLDSLPAGLKGVQVDAVLIHEPQLQPPLLAQLQGLQAALPGVPMAVIYGFGADSVCEVLATSGMRLLREPQPDVVLAQWLNDMRAGAAPGGAAAPGKSLPAQHVGAPVPRRQWDDAALADFASRSSTIACECPRHVAELLMQLTHFETYSRQCLSRNAADAQLHSYLARLASQARASFEEALQRVAVHEGWPLPDEVSSSAPPGGAATKTGSGLTALSKVTQERLKLRSIKGLNLCDR